MKKFLPLIFVIVLVAACSGSPSDPNAGTATPTSTAACLACATPASSETPTGTAIPPASTPTGTAMPAATMTALPPTATPTDSPTATGTATLAPTDTPTATHCSGYTLMQETAFGHLPNDPIYKNMDIGDGQLTAVIQAWDRKDPSVTFMAIVDSGYNLDFEADTIACTFWYFTGTPTSIYCRANEMWQEKGGNIYRLYVGNHEIPNWSTEFPSDWAMKTWVFTDTTINVPNAIWNSVTVQRGDVSHTFGSGSWTYGQLWDGVNANKVYHFIVTPGWVTNSPKYQGTVWTVSGITSETVNTLIMRFTQMTSEVQLRDDHPMVIKVYCGPETQKPSGWTSIPHGWTCMTQ